MQLRSDLASFKAHRTGMATEPGSTPLPALWGGVECTVARVGDRYISQLDRLGHTDRLNDFDRFAEIGISALRFPVLWENVSPDSPDVRSWGWHDAALERISSLGIAPILGLLHHGSGPRYTALDDPGFPALLAQHARAVAERYPWAQAYTPVNEPLTTARFSGLYGLWYPHARDERVFIRCLLNQCRGVILSMREVRQVNPEARLVQTDDLGKIFSTPLLASQAEFENERRWLSWDLLCGRVTPEHRLYAYLLRCGALESELAWICENACPPDIIGVNHYLSSNRYIDENLDRYPEYSHGGNGAVRYADVLAARVIPDDMASPQSLITEAWDRYRIPVAVTELHNGCTREEQLRWVRYVWDGAVAARATGADVPAVTLWALLGAFDWDSLLTRPGDRYESGVFDVRGPEPRVTAIAALATELSQGMIPSSPVVHSLGWWQRDERFHFGHKPASNGLRNLVSMPARRERPILITGATGTLGNAFARQCVVRGLPYRLLRRSEMDIADPASVRAMLTRLRPWAVINTAGYVRVDEAEIDCERCFRENAIGPAVLAEACEQRRIRLVSFSSDLVFDGTAGRPYVESDPVSPLNEYGRSKAAAESRVLELDPSALMVRTSAFFGPWDKYNFVTIALEHLRRGQPFRAVADATISPTYVPDLVQATLDLLIDGESGLWHLANRGAVTWAELARSAAIRSGLDPGLVKEVEMASLGLPAPRPAYSVLASERGDIMPGLEDALVHYLAESGRHSAGEPEESLAA
jgi:dTDP-4-dehydrorhamnose reductase